MGLGNDMMDDINSISHFDWGEIPANWWGVVKHMDGCWLACQDEPHLVKSRSGGEYWSILTNYFELYRNVEPMIDVERWQDSKIERPRG